MEKKVLTTPIKPEDLENIKAGDIIYLTGHITTCRDVAHRRVVEYGRELPVNVRDGAILHAGPIVRKIEDGDQEKYEMVSVGPTTSMRMEKFEYEFVKTTGVRLIVGKGGMGPERSALAPNSKPCTSYSPLVTQYWLLRKSKKSKMRTGKNWACRKPFGPAVLKNSVR